MARVGQLVNPDKIEEKVNETLEKKGKIPFSVLVSLAPFMGKEMFQGQWSGVSFDFGDDADDGESDEVDLDEMDEDEVAELAFKALESGEATDIYLDYMDEDDVAELASKALEAGKSIECYLDYMDEDAVKNLLLQSTKR